MAWIVDGRRLICLALLAPFLVGCGTPVTAPSRTAQDAGLTKPSDAKTAVNDAIRRTAVFVDVKYDQVNTTTTGTQRTTFAGTIISTMTPPRTEVKSTPTSGTGPALDSIQDLGAGTFCSLQPQPGERLIGQSTDVGSVSPFAELKDHVTGWIYLGDATLDGVRLWRATGRLDRAVPGAILVGSAEADIDGITGKIVKTITTVTTKRDSVTSKSETVLSDFVYNSGVAVAAC